MIFPNQALRTPRLTRNCELTVAGIWGRERGPPGPCTEKTPTAAIVASIYIDATAENVKAPNPPKPQCRAAWKSDGESRILGGEGVTGVVRWKFARDK